MSQTMRKPTAKPRTFRDIDGNTYPESMSYFQPYEPEGELQDRFGEKWHSFEVWLSKERCANLFPEMEIREYHGDDIEEPRFVDKQLTCWR